MADARYFVGKLKTPIGTSVLIADENGVLRQHDWDDPAETWRSYFHRRFCDMAPEPSRDLSGRIPELARFFDGDIEVLDAMPVLFTGTPFQNKVWKALRAIKAGTTTSYGALAKKIGAPNAMRAVGLANGQNPIGVVVPCHRVIGADGSLTGYGGGLPRKKWLLAHEARHASEDLFSRKKTA
jgi:methylated-DNA-[protein]-cysteine S-methyltransferase